MAFTKTEYNYELAPAHNLNWVTALNNTDYNENSFRYSFDVRVTDIGGTFTPGLTGTSIGTFFMPPRPVTGEAKFAPSGIWKDVVFSPLDPAGASGGGATGTGYKQTQVIYNYSYVNSSGTTITGTAITGATKRTWAAIFDYVDFASYDATEWEVGGTATVAATKFLTDGPLSRCALPNDLLYTLVKSFTPATGAWLKADTVSNNTLIFSNGFYSGAWTQVTNPDSTGGTDLTWQYQASVGLFAGSGPFVNSYSNILVPLKTSSEVRLRPGGTYNIEFFTDSAFGELSSGYNIFGRRDDTGVWEFIALMDEFDYTGALAYQKTGTIGSSYGYTELGLAVDAGYSFTARLSTILTWNYQNLGGVAWRVIEGSTVTEYPATLGAMNYLNVGTLALGTTNDFSVKIINTATGSAFTNTINYSADCNTCGNCEKVTLVWLNSKAGFDSYQFRCINNKTLTTTRQVADRFVGEGYTVGQRGFMNVKNSMQYQKTVNTNYEGQTDIEWLESLFLSPDVYELQDDNTLIPVIVDTTSYSTFVTPDKLKIAQFQYRLAYNINSQNI
jgi:hypothetical protein